MGPDEIDIVVDSHSLNDPVYVVEIVTPSGSLHLLGEFELGAGSIVIRGLHIGGDPAVQWGWSRLRTLGRRIAEILDVDEIILHGAVRTTGANPGRRPREVRLRRAHQPGLPSRR